MCSIAPLLGEEKSFTDTKLGYTKCEYFPETIPCRNEIQGLILEVVMMHLELCESILRFRNLDIIICINLHRSFSCALFSVFIKSRYFMEFTLLK